MIDFTQAITKEVKYAVAAEAVKASISARRYQAETSGMTVNGLFIDTGRDSQALITGAALSAFMDDTYVCNWKTPGGFVALDAPTLLTISKAIRTHVQACFDRESALLDIVAKGTFKDYLLERGWPTYEPVSVDA